MLPIHMVQTEEQFKAIEDNYCYLIGSNGIFLRKRNMVFECTHELSSSNEDKKQVAGLLKIEPHAKLLIPRFTAPFIKEVVDFFYWCYEEHKSEGFVYLYYNQTNEKNPYLVIPAEQTVTGASVAYGEMPDPPEGYTVIGTMHSHGSMGASHSGTDHNDQSELDGIHITVGKLDSNSPDFDIKLYILGTAYTVKEENILPLSRKVQRRFPEGWKLTVKKRVYATPEPGFSTWGGNYTRSGYPMGSTLVSNENIRRTVQGFLTRLQSKDTNTITHYSSASDGIKLVATKLDIQIENWQNNKVIGTIARSAFNKKSDAEQMAWFMDKIQSKEKPDVFNPIKSAQRHLGFGGDDWASFGD